MDQTLPTESDIVVVGGGVMGTSTAFFLARDSDRDVLLLEKDAIAAGSTGDSSAILRHHYGGETIYTEMARWSHRFFCSFRTETDANIAYERSPLVRFAEEDTPGGRYAHEGYEALAERDLPVSKYRADELPEQYPMYDVEGYDFAISDGDAAYSDGTDAAMGFTKGAREHGATIRMGVAVEAIEASSDTVSDTASDGVVTGVQTSQGTIACDTVIVAAGPWTSPLATTVGIDVPITPVREQVLLLDPPAEYAERYPSLTPTTSIPGGEWYIRPDFGDGILVATHRHIEEVDPNEYDDVPDEEMVLELVDRLGESIPELTEAGVKGRYCGIYSTTPDHDFIIDQAGPRGCYLTCGFSGHGFKHAPAVGRMSADLVLDGDTDLVDSEFFSLDRFVDNPAGHGRPDDFI